MNNINERLEFNKIKEILYTFTASTLGKQLVDELEMYNDKQTLLYQLELTKEAYQLVFSYGAVPLGGVSDISNYVQKATMDGVLYPQDLLAVARNIEAVRSIKNYCDENELDTINFNELVKKLTPVTSLLQDILRCVNYDGTILDNASSELYGIRKRIRQIEASIHVKMEQLAISQKDYLSEAIVTTRNDRFVLPVKSASKGNVRGIIHAESASSKTSYIEPESIVLINNQLTEERHREIEEIERILFELSQSVKANALSLKYNQEILQILDFMFAKGKYATNIDGVIATIDFEYKGIELKQARHPLIEVDKVVANDIEIVDPYEMLLITGSNTGGKTVALKTVGLLSIMALSGLAVPAVSATIPFYDQVFCDLGDEQSIEQSLSTFSSHMKRIISILDRVTTNSLVLIDEIGSGTDPREGECLAQAILDELHEFHCHTIASTHYSGLKKYAQEKEYVIFASVEFDLELMRPTYRLLSGLIGQSYAFEISTRLGLKSKIVEKARKIKEDAMSEEDRLLETLETELENNRQLQERLEASIVDNNKIERELNHKIRQFENNKEKMMQDAKTEANKYIEESKQLVQVVLDELKQNSYEVKPHVVIDAKHQLDKLKVVDEKTISLSNDNRDYVVGDRVKILSLGREGSIAAVNKNGTLSVSLGGLKMQLKKEEVEFIGKVLKQKTKSNSRSVIKTNTSGSYEVNVIGLRYEEAMRIVDKFLDDALLNHYPHVRVVHGMGTGVLRKGVRKMIERNKSVKSFRDGGPTEGGLGATVVFFE